MKTLKWVQRSYREIKEGRSESVIGSREKKKCLVMIHRKLRPEKDKSDESLFVSGLLKR